MRLTRCSKIISGLALAITFTLTGIVGFAQQQTTQEQKGQDRTERRGRRGGDKGRHGMRGGGGHFFAKLNLTDAQREQMKQIAARYRESSKATRQQRREKSGGFEALNGGTFNEAAVRAAAQARANQRVEMEVARAHMMYEMYNVLTAEQKSQLAAERQQREQKRQEWRSRRSTGAGQNQ